MFFESRGCTTPYSGKNQRQPAFIPFNDLISSFLGVILVTQSDSTLSTELDSHDLPSHPILGDLAALLSAAFYAVYVILLKVRVGDEDRADMQLMLG